MEKKSLGCWLETILDCAGAGGEKRLGKSFPRLVILAEQRPEFGAGPIHSDVMTPVQLESRAPAQFQPPQGQSPPRLADSNKARYIQLLTYSRKGKEGNPDKGESGSEEAPVPGLWVLVPVADGCQCDLGGR